MSSLKHVAVIPDGNRRWAKKRGLSPWIGHQQGALATNKLLEKALAMDIYAFTFWCASWDNLTKRSDQEVGFLFKVFDEFFRKALDSKQIHDNKVKVSFLGRWREIFPKNTQEVMEKIMEKTKGYDKHFLTMMVAYSGTDEMEDCVRKIAEQFKEGKISKIDGGVIKQNLWSKDLPPVDLVIRTGTEGDPHNSAGFMMWDTAYSQMYFTETAFPDFTPEHFEKAINDFNERERRKGA
jgi:undecaprenyl diphosphate synthase